MDTLCCFAGSGGSFQIFAEKTDGGTEDVMCLNEMAQYVRVVIVVNVNDQ